MVPKIELPVASQRSQGSEEFSDAEEFYAGELDSDWQFDLPENHDMDGELLGQLHSALENTQMLSFVTVKDGYIIDKYYMPITMKPVYSRYNPAQNALPTLCWKLQWMRG